MEVLPYQDQDRIVDFGLVKQEQNHKKMMAFYRFEAWGFQEDEEGLAL